PSHLPLHSFPTRRSSDLERDRALIAEMMRGATLQVGGRERAIALQLVVQERRIAEERRELRQVVGALVELLQTLPVLGQQPVARDRKSTRLNSSHDQISY